LCTDDGMICAFVAYLMMWWADWRVKHSGS